ncbi:MAG TPA: hypothetical protein VNA14_02915 [Mycobacteriales bacterium]|nr:hypothetical protein [Mycobacteriales bacterium]
MPDSHFDARRTPGQGKYARPEVERRFRVTDDPGPGEAEWRIEDRYLDGLWMRLRRVAQGDVVVHKLTQKVRGDEQDPATVSLTTMYISAEEHAVLAELPGAILVKVRRLHPIDTSWLAVDTFLGALEGLLLAEVEVTSLDDDLALPAWIGDEVTHDDRFSGGLLARATPDDIAALLSSPRTR